MFPVSSPSAHNLSGSAPHVLQETIFLCKSVHRIVALAHGTDEAAKGVDLVLASGTAVLVDLGDGKLDGGVVLGLDDAVGGRALAWDVTGGNYVSEPFSDEVHRFGQSRTGRRALRVRSPF